jgi:hypothetical protein
MDREVGSTKEKPRQNRGLKVREGKPGGAISTRPPSQYWYNKCQNASGFLSCGDRPGKTAVPSTSSPARDLLRQAAVLRFHWRIAEGSARFACIDIATEFHLTVADRVRNIRWRDDVRRSVADLNPSFDFQHEKNPTR